MKTFSSAYEFQTISNVTINKLTKLFETEVWKCWLTVNFCVRSQSISASLLIFFCRVDVPVLLQVPCVLFMCNNSLLLSTDLLSQLQLHPLHGDAPQQGVLLREQPDEGSDRADAAQLRDAAGSHLHAAARPLRPAAQGVAGQFAVSPSCSSFFFFYTFSQLFLRKETHWADTVNYEETSVVLWAPVSTLRVQFLLVQSATCSDTLHVHCSFQLRGYCLLENIQSTRPQAFSFNVLLLVNNEQQNVFSFACLPLMLNWQTWNNTK